MKRDARTIRYLLYSTIVQVVIKMELKVLLESRMHPIEDPFLAFRIGIGRKEVINSTTRSPNKYSGASAGRPYDRPVLTSPPQNNYPAILLSSYLFIRDWAWFLGSAPILCHLYLKSSRFCRRNRTDSRSTQKTRPGLEKSKYHMSILNKPPSCFVFGCLPGRRQADGRVQDILLQFRKFGAAAALKLRN